MEVLVGVVIGWLLGIPTGFLVSKFFSFTGQLKIKEEEVERRTRNRMQVLGVMKEVDFKKSLEATK